MPAEFEWEVVDLTAPVVTIQTQAERPDLRHDRDVHLLGERAGDVRVLARRCGVRRLRGERGSRTTASTSASTRSRPRDRPLRERELSAPSRATAGRSPTPARPSVSITGGPSGAIAETSAHFDVRRDRQRTRLRRLLQFRCRLDSQDPGAFQACSSRSRTATSRRAAHVRGARDRRGGNGRTRRARTRGRSTCRRHDRAEHDAHGAAAGHDDRHERARSLHLERDPVDVPVQARHGLVRRLHLRRSRTPASPSASTRSRCARSTRRGTSTRRRPASPGRSSRSRRRPSTAGRSRR